MKKLLIVALMLLTSISMVGCVSDEVLANADKDYYVTGQFAGWGDVTKVDTFKMTAIALSDERVKPFVKQLKGATALYIFEVSITEGATWSTDVERNSLKQSFNGNHAVKIVRTATDDEIVELWLPSPEASVTNLTPETYWVPEYVEASTGNGSWENNPVVYLNGTYYVIYAEVGTAKYIAIVAK